jgi:hypothetical protein
MLRVLVVALTLWFLVVSPASMASSDRQRPRKPSQKTIYTRTPPTVGGRVAGD